VGELGQGNEGLYPQPTTQREADAYAYAARYLDCGGDAASYCSGKPRFCASCWIDRDDIDPSKIGLHPKSSVPSQVKWHPGWRVHLKQSRVIAFTILDALQVAVQKWSDGTMGTSIRYGIFLGICVSTLVAACGCFSQLALLLMMISGT
jgi:hypothetical protein